MNGTIKRLAREKGFGFIQDANGRLWFFHRTDVHSDSFDHLREGQLVRFDRAESLKWPRAAYVETTPSR